MAKRNKTNLERQTIAEKGGNKKHDTKRDVEAQELLTHINNS